MDISADVLANRYEIGAIVGQGAMGVVYRATDRTTGQTVALKALRPEVVAANPTLLTRFQREGEALRMLNHPNIVTMLDSFVIGWAIARLVIFTTWSYPLQRDFVFATDVPDHTEPAVATRP